MDHHLDLVLLVVAVTPVQAGSGRQAVARRRRDHGENYNRFAFGDLRRDSPLDNNLHSPPRRLIELRMEHADLDSLIDQAALVRPTDELALRRLKKRRLVLRDKITRLESDIKPREPA